MSLLISWFVAQEVAHLLALQIYAMLVCYLVLCMMDFEPDFHTAILSLIWFVTLPALALRKLLHV